MASAPSWYFLLLMGRGSKSLPGPLQSPVWWVSPFCSWRGKGRLDMSQGSWKPKSPLSSWPSCPPSGMHTVGTQSLKNGIGRRVGTERGKHWRNADFLKCQPSHAGQQVTIGVPGLELTLCPKGYLQLEDQRGQATVGQTVPTLAPPPQIWGLPKPNSFPNNNSHPAPRPPPQESVPWQGADRNPGRATQGKLVPECAVRTPQGGVLTNGCRRASGCWGKDIYLPGDRAQKGS